MDHILQEMNIIKIEFRVFQYTVSSLHTYKAYIQSIHYTLSKMLKCYFKYNVSAIIRKCANFYMCTRGNRLSHLCSIPESKKGSQKLNHSIFLETL